jgi:hypothetical protein
MVRLSSFRTRGSISIRIRSLISVGNYDNIVPDLLRREDPCLNVQRRRLLSSIQNQYRQIGLAYRS